MATDDTSGTRNTTFEFLRSFSVVEGVIDEEDDFDVLSPIPETADCPDFTGDILDGADRIDPIHCDGHGLQFVPFRTIHNKPDPFNTIRANCWIGHLPVEVKLTKHEKHVSKMLNPYLYTIEVKHGDFEWTVKRRYKHFRQLHDALTLYRARYRLPIPKKEYRERRKTMKQDHRVSVRFPLRPDYLVSEHNILERMTQLEKYLCSLLKCKSFKNHSETMRFFEVSPLSFINKLGRKGKEGLIKKCSGGRRINIGCCGCLSKVHLAGTWNRRWLVIKDNFVAYIRPEDGAVSDVMLMDSEFSVQCGMATTGAPHGVLISNLNRKLLIKCWTSRKAREWKECLEDRAQSTARDYTQVNRFKSYAPHREDSYARWFVDASSYFEAVADALEKAKEEIFIADWWLSPEIYMKRPMVDGDKWRLDVILQRKAEMGVKVYILLYKEVELALQINSRYSKHILMNRNTENIRVLRHPDHGANGVLLWAHHEKLVVIDQSVAFLGGIDLCYGRWDDEKHRLKDLGSVDLMQTCSEVNVSSISIRPEESAVTDTTELNDDLGSTDKLTVPTSLPLTQVSPADVSIHVIPASPDERPEDTIEDHVTQSQSTSNSTNQSETVTQNSQSTVNSEVNESELTKNVINQSECTRTSQSLDQSDDVARTEDNDVVDGAVISQNPVLEAQTNDKNSAESGVHLWKEKANQKDLKLIIPKKGRVGSGAKSKLKKSVAMDTGDVIVPETVQHVTVSHRHSASSDTSSRSHNSETELIGGEQRTPQGKVIGKTGTDVPDMFSAAVRLKAVKKLMGSEQNNNKGSSQGGAGAPGSPTSNPSARRRWKMVFNVQKFESVVRKNQVPERIPRELLMGEAKKKRKNFLMGKFRERTGSFDLRLDLPPDIQRTKSEQDIAEKGLQGSSRLWIGKDYVNFIHKDFVELHSPYADFIDRNVTPRMPWHDIGAVVYGKGARDVARHFIARWNFTKLAKCKKNNNFPLLLPKNNVKCQIPQSIKNITFNVKTQILRSTSGWSAGIEAIENSIQEAYIHCIENSKHYIYIENQFFITQVDNSSLVSNDIGNALYKRILRAHRAGEKFRVYVMMPLLPAFEGEFGTPGGTALQAVTHWNYSSICRGGNSLIEKLSKEVPDPMQYIIFNGLRTHDELNGKTITELVYVHSKLMIVDDDTVIIGSANINDRSMLGKRDSEMAMMVEDLPKNKFEISFGDRKHMAGKFASSLRRTLFNEHLGLGDMGYEVDDIVSDSFYKGEWIKRASINTAVYEKVFNCIPCDDVHSFTDLKKFQSEKTLVETNQSEAEKLLQKVKGHVVLMPLNFLKNENLAPKVGTKEAILPSYLWT
ncbi:phospholipase D1-like isoform X2 [Haliotis cracherodii]|uniref:phospholipase D1-like isoform X2 n=1 Tax=Haliotis cracherodii TaxID=6455 RepID=UPI0039EA3C4F